MKKTFKILLLGIMSMMLVACGKEKSNDNNLPFFNTETESEEKTEEPKTEDKPSEEVNVTNEKKTKLHDVTYFSGGIAVATIEGNDGEKNIGIINDNLEVIYINTDDDVMYEDCYNGRVIFMYQFQKNRPGFFVVDSTGNIVYECSDECVTVTLTKNGYIAYIMHESNMTEDGYYACFLNEKYENVGKIAVPMSGVGNDRIYYLSDGYYAMYEGSHGNTSGLSVIDLENKTFLKIGTNPDTGEKIEVSMSTYTDLDFDRCVGFRLQNSNESCSADKIDYSQLSGTKTIRELVAESNYVISDQYSDLFKHGYHSLMFDKYDLEDGQVATRIVGIDGLTFPDLGAEVKSCTVSLDGKYYGLMLAGADGEFYHTVIDSNGQKLYEPVAFLGDSPYVVCNGYIINLSGRGLTPDGTQFELGDGTDLSSLGNECMDCVKDEELYISEGYIVCDGKLYKLDGTRVKEVIVKQ